MVDPVPAPIVVTPGTVEVMRGTDVRIELVGKLRQEFETESNLVLNDIQQYATQLYERLKTWRKLQSAKGIKVLTSLSWQENAARAFLEGWRRGDPIAPLPAERRDPGDVDQELAAIEERCDRQDPCGRFIAALDRYLP